MRITRPFVHKTVGLVVVLVAATNILLSVDYIFTGQVENRNIVPLHVALLFPTGVSPTAVSLPPLHHDTPTPARQEEHPDIFQRLARWDNISLDFHASSVLAKPMKRYKWKNTSPYTRTCNRGANGTIWWKKPAECYLDGSINHTTHQKSGNHILFTVRTTASLHHQRLPLIFQTWLSTANRSNVVLVTDGRDRVLKHRTKEAGIRVLASIPGYERLCEKAGDELSLMFLSGMFHYQWICHVDDDMHVNIEELKHVLNMFLDNQPVYFGHSGTFPGAPRAVIEGVPVGTPGDSFDFAVGGLYCLNRPLLNMARRWLGERRAFGRMCNITKEPEDVTVGFVVGIILGLDLNHTLLIHSHGDDLRGVESDTLRYQIGISYGFGNIVWGNRPNAVSVPHNLFSLAEDPSRFLSLHCLHHGEVDWCRTQRKRLLEKKHQLYFKNHRTTS